MRVTNEEILQAQIDKDEKVEMKYLIGRIKRRLVKKQGKLSTLYTIERQIL